MSVAEIASKLHGENGHTACPGCFTSGVIGSSAVRKRAGEGLEGMAEVRALLEVNGKSHSRQKVIESKGLARLLWES